MAKIKIGTIVTKLKLCNAFDRHAIRVLSDYLDPQQQEKGKQRKYKITKELPELREYNALKTAKFTRSLSDLIDEAYSEIKTLAEEMQEVHDNMPENLQETELGNARQEAADQLSDVQRPEIPNVLESLTVLHYPSSKLSSRSDRAAEAVSILYDCATQTDDWVAEQQDKGVDLEDCCDEFTNQLRDDISTVEDVEFPGMYG